MEIQLKNELEKRKSVLVSYLLSKVHEQDWHGVADAAMDIREVEAELKMLEKVRRHSCITTNDGDIQRIDSNRNTEGGQLFIGGDHST